jgi:hypothetical protein
VRSGRRQEVDDAVGVEVDEDRTVRAAPPQRPVVHAERARRLAGRQRGAADEAQQRVGARRHRQARCEPRPGLGPDRDAQRALRRRQAAGAPGAWGEQAGDALGEGATAATAIAAVESAHAQLQAHRPARRWQVRRATDVGAVRGVAHLATRRAPRAGAVPAGRDPHISRATASRPLDAAARHWVQLLHALLYSQQRSWSEQSAP